MTANELETRLFFYGTQLLHLDEAALWAMPYHRFADMWAMHKIYMGRAREAAQIYIDDVI